MLSEAAQEAIGYLGGGVLALCLIPQIGKIVMTRSARDISILWSLLYLIGLSLTLSYLVIKNAMAAWIPLVFEVAGCLAIMSLKLFFEYTLAGRRWSLAKQINLDVSVHSLPGISHVTSVTGAAAEDMWRAAVDRSIRGGTIMQSPSLELQQDVNASKHGSFSHSHVEVQCNGSDCTHAQEVL